MHQLLTNFCSAFGYHLDYYQRDSKATVSHRHFTLNVSCVPIIPTFALCSHRHLGTLTNRSSKETSQRHAKQSGAVEACWAHNPEVRGSKPRSAIFIFISKKKCHTFLQNPERTRIVLVRTREYSLFWVFQEDSVCSFVLVFSQIIISSTSCDINSSFLLDHQCHVSPWLHRFFFFDPCNKELSETKVTLKSATFAVQIAFSKGSI